MSSQFDTRLAELGITLPDTPAPAANYVPFVCVGQYSSTSPARSAATRAG